MKTKFASIQDLVAAIDAGIDAYLEAGRFVPLPDAAHITSHNDLLNDATPCWVVWRDYEAWAKEQGHPVSPWDKSLTARVKATRPDWRICRAQHAGSVHTAWAVARAQA